LAGLQAAAERRSAQRALAADTCSIKPSRRLEPVGRSQLRMLLLSGT